MLPNPLENILLEFHQFVKTYPEVPEPRSSSFFSFKVKAQIVAFSIKKAVEIIISSEYEHSKLSQEVYQILSSDINLLQNVVNLLSQYFKTIIPVPLRRKKQPGTFVNKLKEEDLNMLIDIIYLCAIFQSLKWPFSEAETANIMVAVSRFLDEVLESKTIINRIIKEPHWSRGINLSHLDPVKIIESIHDNYLEELFKPVTVFYFFHLNEDLTRVLKTLINTKTIATESFSDLTLKELEEFESLIEALKIVILSDERERSKKIREKLKAELKVTLTEYLKKIDVYSKDFTKNIRFQNFEISISAKLLKSLLKKSSSLIEKLLEGEVFERELHREVDALIGFIRNYLYCSSIEVLCLARSEDEVIEGITFLLAAEITSLLETHFEDYTERHPLFVWLGSGIRNFHYGFSISEIIEILKSRLEKISEEYCRWPYNTLSSHSPIVTKLLLIIRETN